MQRYFSSVLVHRTRTSTSAPRRRARLNRVLTLCERRHHESRSAFAAVFLLPSFLSSRSSPSSRSESFRLSFYRLILTSHGSVRKWSAGKTTPTLTDPVALAAIRTSLIFIGVTVSLELFFASYRSVLNETFAAGDFARRRSFRGRFLRWFPRNVAFHLTTATA
jgi:hypothetical protein